MITRIEIDGFKSFLDFDLDVPPFLLVVGRNGAGKSNLFDALGFVNGVVRDGLERAVLKQPRGSARDLFHRDESGGIVDRMRIVVGMVADSPYGPLALRCRLVVHRDDLRISMQDGSVWVSALESTDWIDVRSDAEPSLDVLRRSRAAYIAAGHQDKVRFDAGSDHELLSILRQETATWSPLILDPAAMRRPASVPDALPLQPSGDNLAAVLYRLSEQDKLWQVTVDLSAIVQDAADVVSVFDARRQEADFEIVFRDGVRTLPALLSDGTLRATALLAALHDAETGALVVEEVENGLHPSRLGELVRRLRRGTKAAASPRQVILTTHSPVLLSEFQDEYSGSLVFFDTAIRVGGGRSSSSVTVALPVDRTGEPGTYISPRQVRQTLSYVRQADA